MGFSVMRRWISRVSVHGPLLWWGGQISYGFNKFDLTSGTGWDSFGATSVIGLGRGGRIGGIAEGVHRVVPYRVVRSRDPGHTI